MPHSGSASTVSVAFDLHNRRLASSHFVRHPPPAEMTLDGNNESADRLFHAGRHGHSDLRHARPGALPDFLDGRCDNRGSTFRMMEFHAHF
jgi:hypothetical protein